MAPLQFLITIPQLYICQCYDRTHTTGTGQHLDPNKLLRTYGRNCYSYEGKKTGESGSRKK